MFQPNQVIDCSDACTARPLNGSCIPGMVTGWDASLPCKCNNSLAVVNCQPFPAIDRHSEEFAESAQPLRLHLSIQTLEVKKRRRQPRANELVRARRPENDVHGALRQC